MYRTIKWGALLSVFAFIFLTNISHAEAATIYFYPAVDTAWSTTGNWFTNIAHTAALGDVPASDDDVVILGVQAPAVDIDTWTEPASINSGSTGVVFTSASDPEDPTGINITITGNATFNGTAANYATVTGNAIFNWDALYYGVGTVGGNASFPNLNTQHLNIDGSTNFAWDGVVSGTVSTAAGTVLDWTFEDGTSNAGKINGDAIFNGSAQNANPGGDIIGDATFNGTLYDIYPLGENRVTGTVTFTNDVTFKGWNNFAVTASMPGTDTWVFEGSHEWIVSSGNLAAGNNLTGSTTFGGDWFGSPTSGTNSAVITGTTTFVNSSGNYGIIFGDAIFYEDTTFNNASGVISGTKTRIYTADATTTTDFTVNSPWVVVADGAIVNVEGATYDTNTVFQAINGGSFVYGSNTAVPAVTLYWYKTGADANWTTLSGNWWLDSGHTTPASSLPSSSDAVVLLGSTKPIIDLDSGSWEEPRNINATATGGVTITSAAGASISTVITGNATFNGTAKNVGIVTGTATFTGTAYTSDPTGSAGSKIFTQNVLFTINNDWIANTSTWTFSGTKSWIFAGQNWGTITGNVTFTNAEHGGFSSDYANHGTVIGTATFEGNDFGGKTENGQGGLVQGTAVFNYASENVGIVIGNTTFNDASNNYGTVTGNATFNDTADNWGGTVSGTATFNGSRYENTVNDPGYPAGTAGTTRFTDDVVFEFRNGIAWRGDASDWIFDASATWRFYDTSYNLTAIPKDAEFWSDENEPVGTITGRKSRVYETYSTPSRNFVATGPWTVVAYYTTVNLTGSTYNSNTTLKTVNGTFTPSGLSLPSISLISPRTGDTVTSWNPSVAFNSNENSLTGVCSYSYDGINFTGIRCRRGGTDIPAPNEGQGILSVRKVNNASTPTRVTILQANFNYQPNPSAAQFSVLADVDPVFTEVTTSGGGTASLLVDGKGISVTIPVDFASTTDDAVFEITQMDIDGITDAVPLSDSLNPIPEYTYQLRAVAGTTTPLSSFDEPLTVTMYYGNDDISGFDESSLTIQRYDEGTDWTTLSNCSADTTANTVTCDTDHFSVFTLLGESAPVSSGNAVIARSGVPRTRRVAQPVISPLESPQPVTIAYASSTPSLVSPYVFSRSLTRGVTHNDVRNLQKFLNAKGFTIAATGAGSVGNETTYFGPATFAALKRFQTSVKLPSTGFFGPMTRALINK